MLNTLIEMRLFSNKQLKLGSCFAKGDGGFHVVIQNLLKAVNDQLGGLKSYVHVSRSQPKTMRTTSAVVGSVAKSIKH